MFDHNQTFIVNWALSTGHLPLCQYSFMATTAVGLGMTGSVSPTDWGGSLLVTWGCRPQRWHLPLAILVCEVSATEVTSATGYSGVWGVSHRGDVCHWLFWCVRCQPQRWHLPLAILVCGVSATEVTSATGYSGVWNIGHRGDINCGCVEWSVGHRGDICYRCVECWPQRWHQQLVCGVCTRDTCY